MAIRIRQVGDKVVALCAAKSSPKEGDIYLDDNIHHALATKFSIDFTSEGWGNIPYENDLADIMIQEQGGELY